MYHVEVRRIFRQDLRRLFIFWEMGDFIENIREGRRDPREWLSFVEIVVLAGFIEWDRELLIGTREDSP